MQTLERAELAVEQSWAIGRLRYKLQPQQRVVYDTIKRCPPEEIFSVVCSRGFGKTFIGSNIAIELSRQATNANIIIISSTLKKLRTIIKPAFDTLLEDCPAEFLPKYNSQDSVYAFPTGVNVHLCAGEKGHVKDLRGIHNVILVLIDEAGFFGDEESTYPLDYVIEHILNPMFLRAKVKPRTIMLTTPPETPNHPIKAYHDVAKAKGCAATFTIYESDIPPEKIAEAKERCKDPLAWRREYLCEWVVDESRLIIPEWRNYFVGDTREHEFVSGYDEKAPLLKFWDKYFSLDIGSVDKTVGLLAFYNFQEARLYFADEIIRQGREWTTEDLAADIKTKEALRWGEGAKIYRRIGDTNNQILLSDLTTLHKLPISGTTKASVADGGLLAMVSEARMWVNSGRVRVHPRCRLLIASLSDGMWTAKKDEFARSVALGHMDALASFIYMIRNIDALHNPVPVTYGFDPATQYWDQARQLKPGHTMQDIYVKGNPFMQQEAE
jgi:terminase large subunit-like protein